MTRIKPIRMKKRKMFVHVADAGTKVVCSGMVVQACPNELGVVRTGFTTTKKLGKAVVRNRIRRRLREVVRLCPKMADMVGFDLVFIGRQATFDRPFEKLKADLFYILGEILRQNKEKADA